MVYKLLVKVAYKCKPQYDIDHMLFEAGLFILTIFRNNCIDSMPSTTIGNIGKTILL